MLINSVVFKVRKQYLMGNLHLIICKGKADKREIVSNALFTFFAFETDVILPGY